MKSGRQRQKETFSYLFDVLCRSICKFFDRSEKMWFTRLEIWVLLT